MDLATTQILQETLAAGAISSKAMLSTFRMLDESSRDSPAYSDPRYAPFYYLLGKERPSKSVVEFGFGIGICSGCYVRGCKSVERILAFQETGKNYYSPRIGIHNVKSYFKGDLNVYVGKVMDREFLEQLSARKWELAILNEEKDYDSLMEYLELVWDNMAYDGTLVMDYAKHHEQAAAAYADFCRRKGRDSRILNTRYGVGVITR